MNEEKNYEEEINFKDVAKTPIRWFGLVYPYIIVVMILIGLYYIWSFNTLSDNAIKAMIIDSTVFKEQIPMKKGAKIEGIDINTVKEPSEQMIAKGAELYKANCKACHGDQGKGDGSAGSALNPKPRNFTETTGWKNGPSLTKMYSTLEKGIPGSAMVAYEYLPTLDKFALIHYIQKTFFKEIPKITQGELDTLNITYKLSEGRIDASTIPIKLAMEKLISENNTKVYIPDTIATVPPKENIIQYHPEKGKAIFELYSCNLKTSTKYLFKLAATSKTQESFTKALISTIPSNGFKTAIIRLNKDDWQNLFFYSISLNKK
jgi:hypothetical protein